MNTNNPNQEIADISSVLGPASMLDAKFDDSFLGNVFDLDIDANEEEIKESDKPKIH